MGHWFYRHCQLSHCFSDCRPENYAAIKEKKKNDTGVIKVGIVKNKFPFDLDFIDV